ncbi:MAG: Rne/Rng family ribonuclease, partial [Geminicoccaceae bacterium]|nr:Rne/Rng family ribonuclease [Geminicoccaceae bacterium]
DADGEETGSGDGDSEDTDDEEEVDEETAARRMEKSRREAAVTEDADEETAEEVDAQARMRARLMRSYKIQEVIKRRQILLVQVVKEERGNKGAALTTYLSLAGRYCVLMPNTPRGGGISRKIANTSDRRRLKSITQEMEVPDGMGLIVRTAGQQRSKSEIKRDYDFLLRQWSDIRENTLNSVAPSLIYAEGDLIKRAMRDLYSRDLEEVLVEGEDGYRMAKRLMQMMMPSRARNVKQYKDELPLFYRYRVEDQLDAMHSPTVYLPSGGSIVIHTTEALTAIDVNSGRSTRERHIDETAVKTNLEAADEVARQLRLRDLAGLIVIDFIDMAEMRHQRQVERRFREALKVDRARVQVGKISMFGLLELSRQRLRASLQELSSQPCPTCSGLGVIRSTESCALQALRFVQEEGIRNEVEEISLTLPVDVGLYLLNNKREALVRLEERYALSVSVQVDDQMHAPHMDVQTVKRSAGDGEAGEEAESQPARPQARQPDERGDGPKSRQAADEDEEGRGRGKRRRRRRRRRGSGDGQDGGSDEQQTALENGTEDEDAADADGGEDQTVEADGPVITAEGSAAERSDDAGDADGAGDEREEKPRRRRRRSRRSSEASTADDERPEPTEADAAESDAAEKADDGSQDDDGAAKPRTRRRRRRRTRDQDHTADAVQTADTADAGREPEQAASDGAVPGESGADAGSALDEPAGEGDPAEDVPAVSTGGSHGTPEPQGERDPSVDERAVFARTSQEARGDEVEPVEEAGPEPVISVIEGGSGRTEEESADPQDEESGEPRRGWWSRWVR